MSQISQIKVLTGADCNAITIRRHLWKKGFQKQKTIQKPSLLQCHKTVSSEKKVLSLMRKNVTLMVSYDVMTRRSQLRCFLPSTVEGPFFTTSSNVPNSLLETLALSCSKEFLKWLTRTVNLLITESYWENFFVLVWRVFWNIWSDGLKLLISW